MQLVDDAGLPASLGSIATALGVTPPTLRHYFGDYDGVVQAALAESQRQGQTHIDAMTHPGRKRLAASMREVADSFLVGWRAGVGQLFTAAFVHGLGHEVRGMAAIEHLLEPTLQSIEARLAVHAERGELMDDGADQLRVAALAFASPIVLALLHQHGLSGSRCRPLDLEGFLAAHTRAWVRGWGA